MPKHANSNNLGKSLSHVLKQADDVFSRVIRYLPSVNEKTECFFCKQQFHWTTMDCMHFRKRRHLATRYLKLNCYPGCRSCHTKYENDEEYFAKKIDELHSEGTSDGLILLSHTVSKLSVSDLIEYITYWNDELKFKSRVQTVN